MIEVRDKNVFFSSDVKKTCRNKRYINCYITVEYDDYYFNDCEFVDCTFEDNIIISSRMTKYINCNFKKSITVMGGQFDKCTFHTIWITNFNSVYQGCMITNSSANKLTIGELNNHYRDFMDKTNCYQILCIDESNNENIEKSVDFVSYLSCCEELHIAISENCKSTFINLVWSIEEYNKSNGVKVIKSIRISPMERIF